MNSRQSSSSEGSSASPGPSLLDGKHFDHADREPIIAALWERERVGVPESARDQSAPVFSVAMPPPNANGELHLGHAFGYTVKDILGRFHRLRGERVLLIPGKDHAGIQTQVVFEKRLRGAGNPPEQQSRELLFDSCYEFCIDRAAYMRAQEKKIGVSADWERELFTLDPKLTKIIYDTFASLWRDGLVYRGSRIVNWSVLSQTSISDVEVEYREQDGTLWYLRYQLDGDSPQGGATLRIPGGEIFKIGVDGLCVATTRPETMLGDTALAVHPEDERYRGLIGRFAMVPLAERRIPIIGDERVDPTYGTGVVKVTPAHDFLDYDIGVDHDLPAIQVIGKDGRMTAEAGAVYAGLTTAECREQVVADLGTQDALLSIQKIVHKVPIGERGKDVIEPLISEQWFVAVDKPGNSLKERALKLFRSGAIAVYPSRFTLLFEQWLENLRDWNISRQLWWGHRIPVWYREVNGKEEVVVSESSPAGDGWRPETDVFDTWFSSGQWAFSTVAALGLYDLEKSEQQTEYFPTHTMVMGRDILFFWACRMLLLTAYRTNQAPWRNIFFTGLIRDERGQKMSKSRGNGIDPNVVIARHGADALRLALIMGTSQGNDLSFSERKIDGYSKFINKLWNAAKLFEMKIGASIREELEIPLSNAIVTSELHLASSRWIVAGVERLKRHVASKLASYDVSIAADEIYSFTWMTYCDWYLEMMKVLVDSEAPGNRREVVRVTTATFTDLLRMLHPFIPFITEDIYQRSSLPKDSTCLALSLWREGEIPDDATSLREIDGVCGAVNAIRSVKAALNLATKRIPVALPCEWSDEARLLIREIAKVDFCSEVTIPGERLLRKPFAGGVILLDVEGKAEYRSRLEKEAAGHLQVIATLEKKLDSDFGKHAKPEIIAQERERLDLARAALKEIEAELASS